MNISLIFIIGVMGVFAVSSISENMLDRAAVDLDRAVRERIYKRQVLGMMWWRAPDLIGIGMMIVGILKIIGRLPLFKEYKWGIPCMTAGLAVICVASIIRAWMNNRAYSVEAPETSASKRAFSSALMVSAAELMLAIGISSYVMSHIPASATGKQSNDGRATPAISGDGKVEGPDNVLVPLWVEERDALKLLPGKNAEYLELLVKTERVRSQMSSDKPSVRLYRRDDIEAEMPNPPTIEEMKQNLEGQKKLNTETPAEKSLPKPSEKTESLKE